MMMMMMMMMMMIVLMIMIMMLDIRGALGRRECRPARRQRRRDA
jgi:hypothetical protein